jgi:hypothetical protein
MRLSVFRGLIVNFEFDPAFEGQKAKPAAAITMSTLDRNDLNMEG